METYEDKNDVYIYTNDFGISKKIYGSLTGKFKVGDTVELVNHGASYSSYEVMADAMKIPKERWMNIIIKDKSIGTIISRKVHGSIGNIVYGVIFKNDEYIIVSQKGLKLICKKSYINKFDDDLFIL